MLRTLLALLLTLALTGGAMSLAACGGGDDEAGESEATPIPIPQDPAADIRRIVAGLGDDTSSKPEIAAPEGSPPPELEKRDIVRGKGARAKPGDSLTMQYVGVSWSTGAEFDASWGKPEPFTFELGAGDVIPGWDEGLVGMREGGRRLLVIPAEKGYGAQGQPPHIGPNETLIFAVDLVRIG
jgi:peptidylprolyl isomerase